MIRPSDIADLRTAVTDGAETDALKARMSELRRERDPFYLTAAELDPVFHWKLRGQYGRQEALRATNPPEAYVVITRAAFEVRGDDPDWELEIRTRILTALRGVGVPVASAILALVQPDDYCVIDFRAWRQVFGEERRSFDVGHYKKYAKVVRDLARDLGWAAQEVDAAIWERDRRIPG
jgi:hypothetical protein